MTGNNLGKGHINDPATPYPAIIKVWELGMPSCFELR